MLKITSREIRDKFLKFFEEKNHLKISGSSVIPSNDPTLLFINSGMAPLKKYFTGEAQPPGSDLCNVQPCIRTIDIDEIGDRHHLTSFEMLGSWSINNYFKEKAISLAFELLVEGLKIPKERLYVTVFSGLPELNLEPDTESAKIWESLGLDKNHIVYQPFEDNFWGPTAETGPCGPCTEVFYDTGDDYGARYVPDGHFDTKSRYIEIWNAGVFMQFNKNSDGTYDNLKFKSVDTGAGLERLTMALNGLTSVYETDLLSPILEEITSQTKDTVLDLRARRIITDHLRTTAFILSEGVKPSNDGRGYIPRRLIRRCAALVQKAKIERFNFVSVLEKVIEQYGDFYTHFKAKSEEIISTFEKERTHFEQILKDGFKRLEKLSEKPGFEINGRDAFLLVSTYGIPIDLISEYANEKGGKLNEDDYKKEFKKHQEISKNSGGNSGENETLKLKLSDYQNVLANFPETEFLGYDLSECFSKVQGIIKEGKRVKSVASGDKALIITDKSCLYAESGGQVSDTGSIISDNVEVDILDVQKNDNKTFVHVGIVKNGELCENDKIKIKIDDDKRLKIKKNHSSVHLLQSALRKVLGNNIRQAGSLVEEDRLRFDFLYEGKPSDEELEQVEMIVNKFIQMDIPLVTEVIKLDDAIKKGALAFFEDKYGDNVRMVKFGNISKELCGGTHIETTGKIGYFKILSEGSVGRGTRRITAVVGSTAIEYVQSQLKILKETALKLKTSPEEILSKLNLLLQTPKQQKVSSFTPLKKDEISKDAGKSEKARAFLVKEFSEFSNEIRDEAIRVAEIMQGVVCFLCNEEDKLKVIVAVHKPISKELNASAIIQKVLKYIDGKGGGQPHLALGGGKKEGKDKIFDEFAKIVDSI